MKRTAPVTGSSRGIGKAAAEEFAKQGYNVVLNYVHSREKAEMFCGELENKYGIDGIAVGADLSKEEDVRELAEKALARFGKIDVLVNNAGDDAEFINSEVIKIDGGYKPV